MGRISSGSSLVCATSLLAALLAAMPSHANSPSVDQAINDYNSKQYASAIAKLTSADQKSALVHYYLALSYQGAGNFASAEKQYQWVYHNSRDKQLQNKSWQGLQGLAEAKRYRPVPMASSANTADDKPVAAGSSGKAKAAPFYVDAHGHPVSSDPSQWFKFEWKPGCPRH